MSISYCWAHLGTARGDVFGHCRVAQEATRLAGLLICCTEGLLVNSVVCLGKGLNI